MAACRLLVFNCYNEAKALLYGAFKQPGFIVHSIRSDATNARIWQRQKLHVTEVASAYALSESEVVETAMISDLQVRMAGTAALARSILIKQCKSVGMPIWNDVAKDHTAALSPENIGAPAVPLHVELRRQMAVLVPDGGKIVLTAYCQTTDAGSDQLGCRRQIGSELDLCRVVMHLHGNCMQHQYHLAFRLSVRMSEFVLHSLFGVSACTYFGTLCKLCNTWRECGKDIYYEWAKLYGALEAKLAERCPKPCLVGRWGAAHESEKHFVVLDKQRLFDVLHAVFDPSAA